MSRIEELRESLQKIYRKRREIERGKLFIDYLSRMPLATAAAGRRAVEEIRRAVEKR